MARSKLISQVKRFMPLPVISILKTSLEVADPFFVGAYHMGSGQNKPIPPRALRARVGSPGIQQFFQAGQNCAYALESALARQNRSMNDFRTVLDFGCGCGRTLQHFYTKNDCQLFGCDVDSSAIGWMQRNYDGVTFAVNQFNPPLPFSEENFDLIYSVSIFSHLNEHNQFQWLNELGRVLKPKGLALLTFQGTHAFQLFRNGPMGSSKALFNRLRLRKSLEVEKFIFEPYDDFRPDKGNYPGIDEAYGLTFHSNEYIYEYWSRFFYIVDILNDGIVDSVQDIVIIKKR